MSLLYGITVVVASYNRADIFKLLYRTLLYDENVREFIFINDGSTSDYSEVVDNIRKYCLSRKIIFNYIVNKRNVGLPASRNIGLDNATSKYVFFSDDDIILQERALSILMDALVKECAQISSVSQYKLNLQEYDACKNNLGAGKYFGSVMPVVSFNKIPLDYRKQYASVFSESKFCYPTMLCDLEFLRENKIRFFEGYRGNAYCEETDFQIHVKKKLGKIIVCLNYFYFHLPAEVTAKSGCHIGNRLWYTFWEFVNNMILILRHRRYLKENHLPAFRIYLVRFVKGKLVNLAKRLLRLFK